MKKITNGVKTNKTALKAVPIYKEMPLICMILTKKKIRTT